MTGFRATLKGGHMNIRNTILKNLEGRIYPINLMTTLHGIKFREGMKELSNMQRDGIINETRTGEKHNLCSYELSWKWKSCEVVNDEIS